MKLEFKVNKRGLVGCIFAYNGKNPKESFFSSWLDLEKRLWKKFKNEPAYYFLNTIHYNWAFESICAQAEKEGFDKAFLKIGKNLEKIYKEIFRSKEFQQTYAETEKYKNWLEKEWKKKEKFIIDYFKNTLGLEIPDYKIEVHVFHPKSYKGNGNFETKIIQWGHPEDWKNYSVVYLAHELLHIIADKEYTETMHAIIELSTDNELRIRLNRKGEYFKKDKKNIGHLNLGKLEKKILPYWKEFLKNKKEESIISLEKNLRIKFKRD